MSSAFVCPFPSCHKRFSRHDNLNQHARVHATSSTGSTSASSSTGSANSSNAGSVSPTCSPVSLSSNGLGTLASNRRSSAPSSVVNGSGSGSGAFYGHVKVEREDETESVFFHEVDELISESTEQ